MPITYAPCVNGVLKAGAVAQFAGQQFTVTTIEYHTGKKRALAHMESVEVADMNATMPAELVVLTQECYLKDEVFDFFSFTHPVDQAYVLYSAIKRVVGMSRKSSSKEGSHTWNLAPATPMTRRLTGISQGRAHQRFEAHVPSGTLGANSSWDSLLGKRWDVLPADSMQSSDALDTVIKSIRFSEHQEYMMTCIRCHICTSNGRFACEDDYRSIIRHNMTVAAEDYYS